MSITWKQRHSLLGKTILHLALCLKATDADSVEERELVRLRKNHALSNYSIEEPERV